MTVPSRSSEAFEPDRLTLVVYTSFATTRFDDRRLDALLAKSRVANRRHGLTGVLLYREQRFLQALEGPAGEVWNLIATISDDPRHHEVDVLVDEPVASRSFPEWSMGYRPWSTSDADLPVGFRSTFDDLESLPDRTATVGAVRDLLGWYSYRAGALEEVD